MQEFDVGTGKEKQCEKAKKYGIIKRKNGTNNKL